MEVESYSQIYYDYIARTINDLLFHILLQFFLQKKCLLLQIAKKLAALFPPARLAIIDVVNKSQFECNRWFFQTADFSINIHLF